MNRCARLGDEGVAGSEMSPTTCPDDFDQLGNKSGTQDRGITHCGQWSVVVDTLAVGAAPVPALHRAGVAGGLALARHVTGGRAGDEKLSCFVVKVLGFG